MSRAATNTKETKASMSEVKSIYQIEDGGNKSYGASNPGNFTRKILNAREVTLIGGPFHYQLRSSTYADLYDEVPWKVKVGLTGRKDRVGYPENPYACQYEPRIMVNNWVEEQRDKHFIKYRKDSRISQFGHHYLSENSRVFKRPQCNKQRDLLLNISKFPITAYPAHQPEVNVDTLKCSTPKPEACVVDEEVEKCRKQMEKEKRYYKATL